MTQRLLDICICTMDFVGPIRNGGIGTAYHALARTLNDAGHRVTVLYALGSWCERADIGHWVDHYAALGIQFVPLSTPAHVVISASPCVKASYETYRWLADRDKHGQKFDVIHFHEWRGLSFYSGLAKRQGLAFSQSVLCVGTHSPELWHRWGMSQFISSVEDLQIDHVERAGVELADVVVSPSQYMLQWMREQHWNLPANAVVRQNILTEYLPAEQLNHPRRQTIRDFVFFGRLETRKGLILFCDALDAINADIEKTHQVNGDGSAGDGSAELAPLKNLQVTFLGKRTVVDNIESGAYLESRGRMWRFAWRIIDDLDHAGAMDYLREPGRIAVIPSLMENSPYTLLECLGNGICCICSDLPGHRELVAETDADAVCFPPRASALAARLREIVRSGALPPRPAHHPDETKAQWLAWHQEIAGTIPGPAISSEKPLVSICMAHRNRPNLLKQALESVRQQDYPNLQLVLVDDGSTQADAIEYLQGLEEEFARRNWKLIRQPNQYLGAARNAAARAADGQYLLFMDDDNVAMPREISTFVTAALASKADVLTCVMAGFRGDEPPEQGHTPYYLWLPLGGALAVGVFSNMFGDANGLIRRDVFEKLGGFTEDFGIGHEDWEFYAKAALAGYRVQVVPETLFWYRVGTASMLRTTNLFVNHMRNLRPYEEAIRPELRTVLQFAQAMFLHRPSHHVELAPPPPSPLPASANKPMEISDFVQPQRLVDEYWNSLSWRISGFIRNTLCKACGMQPPQKPIVTSQREAFIAIEEIRRSISWEATGPLRAMGRTYYAIKPRSDRPSNNGHFSG